MEFWQWVVLVVVFGLCFTGAFFGMLFSKKRTIKNRAKKNIDENKTTNKEKD